MSILAKKRSVVPVSKVTICDYVGAGICGSLAFQSQNLDYDDEKD
jgi:hypothetical protein